MVKGRIGAVVEDRNDLDVDAKRSPGGCFKDRLHFVSLKQLQLHELVPRHRETHVILYVDCLFSMHSRFLSVVRSIDDVLI